MAIGNLLFYEGLLIGHQGESDSGDFASEHDFGRDFGKSFFELILVVVVKERIGSCALCGTEQQSSDFGFTAFGEFSFAFVFAGFAQPHIDADEGNKGITAGERTAVKGADQRSGIQRGRYRGWINIAGNQATNPVPV